MQQVNPPQDTKVQEIEILSGIKLIRTELRIQVPVYEEVTIQKPVFIEEKVKIPIGLDELVNSLALEISKSALIIIEMAMTKQLKLLEDKLSQLSNIKTEEKIIIKTKEVEIDKPVYIDKPIEISRPIYMDKEVINPVLKDSEIVNAIIIDKAVTNAVVTDIRVTNAIIKDVEVERAIIREKVVDVIHPRYLNLKGEEES